MNDFEEIYIHEFTFRVPRHTDEDSKVIPNRKIVEMPEEVFNLLEALCIDSKSDLDHTMSAILVAYSEMVTRLPLGFKRTFACLNKIKERR